MNFRDYKDSTNSVKKSIREVDGQEITTWRREIDGTNGLEVEVGTTGYASEETETEARTFIRLTSLGGMDMDFKFEDDFGALTRSIEIKLEGDNELRTFIKGLEWMTHILKMHAGA